MSEALGENGKFGEVKKKKKKKKRRRRRRNHYRPTQVDAHAHPIIRFLSVAASDHSPLVHMPLAHT